MTPLRTFMMPTLLALLLYSVPTRASASPEADPGIDPK